MGRPPADTVQVSVRVPTEWIDRVTKIAEQWQRRGAVATQASVLRGALGLGIEALEAEHVLARSKKSGK